MSCQNFIGISWMAITMCILNISEIGTGEISIYYGQEYRCQCSRYSAKSCQRSQDNCWAFEGQRKSNRIV